jgi:dipeptidase E
MPRSPRRSLLLLSNSRDAAGNFLVHPERDVRALLGDRVRTVTFVPYAGVTVSWDDYAARARAAFERMGYGLASVHEGADPVAAVRAAEAVVVGGGNTFHLLLRLNEVGLLGPIRERVAAGVPYVGWSAGSVVAAPTIRTTNDMPIVEPPSLTGLGLVPFQINAHYTDFHPPGFQGETRAERLGEFIQANPGVRVIGLPEGTMLRVEDDDIQLVGPADLVAPVFERGRPRADVRAGDDVRFLLQGGDRGAA